jgi:hypothetical protein
MNREQLRSMHMRIVRIRPMVRRKLPDGTRLSARDDDWRVDAQFPGTRAIVRVHNLSTGHFVDLYSDSVHEYREPGFLVLREQLSIGGINGLDREPLADPRLAYAHFPFALLASAADNPTVHDARTVRAIQVEEGEAEVEPHWRKL